MHNMYCGTTIFSIDQVGLCTADLSVVGPRPVCACMHVHTCVMGGRGGGGGEIVEPMVPCEAIYKCCKLYTFGNQIWHTQIMYE